MGHLHRRLGQRRWAGPGVARPGARRSFQEMVSRGNRDATWVCRRLFFSRLFLAPLQAPGLQARCQPGVVVQSDCPTCQDSCACRLPRTLSTVHVCAGVSACVRARLRAGQPKGGEARRGERSKCLCWPTRPPASLHLYSERTCNLLCWLWACGHAMPSVQAVGAHAVSAGCGHTCRHMCRGQSLTLDDL